MMSESLASVNDEFAVEGNEEVQKVIPRTSLSKNVFANVDSTTRETKQSSCSVRKSSTEMGESQDYNISSLSNLTGSDNCLMNTVPASPSSFGSDVSTQQVFTFQNELQALEQSLIKEALRAENEFMHYALSIPKKVPENQQNGASDSKKSSTEVSPKVGLDHLDNLCRLMEQLSELKEANVKLKRRVQYLEDLKSMHEIHREMLQLSLVQSSANLSKDSCTGENNLLRPEINTDHASSPSPDDDDDSSNKDRLQRSKTTASVNSKLDHTKQEHGHRSRNASKEVVRERSKSVGHPDHSKNKNRSSRWSKVKAVLGIEKADDIPQPQCEKKEHSKELKVHQEDNRTCRAGTPYAGRVSPSVRGHSKSRNRHSTVISNEKESDVFASPSSGNIRDQWNEGSKKYSKTPWGKMKTMIQSRRGDARSLRTNNGFATSKSYTDVHAEAFEADPQNVKRNSRPSRKTSFGSQDATKTTHSDTKTKSNTLELGARATSIKESPLDKSANSSKKVNQDRPKSGDYSRNVNEMVMRIASSGKSSPGDVKTSALSSSGMTHKDGKTVLSIGISKKDSSSKKEVSGSKDEAKSTSSAQRSDKPSDIKKDKDSASLEQGNNDDTTNSKNKEDQPTLACTSATVTELLKELQQNLSDDFNKKLEEWHRFRNEGIKPVVTDMERKDSFGKLRKFSKPEKKSSTAEKLVKHSSIVQKKDLHWLEKELQKVEREIVRLSKEKQKFEKRALRLTCLKEAMTESQLKNEVFVKTSAGEFRFEGISNAFTKKLYEWETKKGVGPELSTIALLDESLKTQELQPRECRSITDIDKCSVTLNSDSERFAYRISKSSSEPDFSSLANTSKDSGSPKSAKRCQSGDTFLSFGNDSQGSSSACRKEEGVDKSNEDVLISGLGSSALQHSREDYCGLLEENIFLLDQLKEKEYVCAKLQSELDRLDEKAGKANMMHQEELEKYRQKLWEIHMSRPKDLQGSLQLISELKMRIEELHKCSDQLKSDREKLEESFRQHSEQQRFLSDDLISRIMEMQENLSASEKAHGGRRKNRKHCICGASGVTKIHELSAKLLRQARDMEEALAERTRQVCHLRWELLLRDMSTVLLQAALHRVTYQGPQATLVPTWDTKRLKFKALKAWSIDSTERRQSEATIAEDWLQERLKQLSVTPYKQWTDVQFDQNCLIGTVHELEKEVMTIESCSASHASEFQNQNEVASGSAESETADSDHVYDSGSVMNSRSSSFSSGPSPEMRGSYSDTRLYQRSRSLSIHRNSSSSMSCVSGFEASESSSMHDSDKIQNFMRKKYLPLKSRRTNRWPSKENVSSSCSSRSSIHDGENASARMRMYMGEVEREDSRDVYRQKQQPYQYNRLDVHDKLSKGGDLEDKSWRNQCLITPKRMHIIHDLHSEPSRNDEQSNITFSSAGTSYAVSSDRCRRDTERYKPDIECDVFFSSEDSDTNVQNAKSTEASRRESSTRIEDSYGRHNAPPEGAKDRDGNRDTSRRKDKWYPMTETRTSYITRSERQLFSDIRSLASSCQASCACEGKAGQCGAIVSKTIEVATPSAETCALSSESSKTAVGSTEVAEHENVSPVSVTSYKYKGTQGFGRKQRSSYRDRL